MRPGAAVGLVVVALLLGAPGVSAAADPEPRIVAIELANQNTEVWVATTAGLLRVETDALTGDSEPRDLWELENLGSATDYQRLGGRRDRPIDDVEYLPGTEGEPGFVVAASEGRLWASRATGSAAEWVEVTCEGPECPTGVRGLESTVVPRQGVRSTDTGQLCSARPEQREVIAFGADGMWRLTPPGSKGSGPATGRSWRSKPLGGESEVVAVGQDLRGTLTDEAGRIWALAEKGGVAQLQIHDPYPMRDPTTCSPQPPTTVTRPLSVRGLSPAGSAMLAPDSRGGMWVSPPGALLWMNPDATVRDRLDPCQLRLGTQEQDGSCLPGTTPFALQSIDDNSDDLWVGSADGLVRLSVGASSERIVSKLQGDLDVVDLARNRAGGDAWVATPDALARQEVDRWSYEDDPAVNNLPITVIRAGGAVGEERVFLGTDRGVIRATWNNNRGRLDFQEPVDGPAGPIRSISRFVDGRGVFLAPPEGLWLVPPEGPALKIPNMEQRVSAVEVIADRVYIGTVEGAFSAALNGASGVGPFSELELVDAQGGRGRAPTDDPDDVTAIWEVDGTPWFGTSNHGLRTVPGGGLTWCPVGLASSAVVRSGTSTAPSSFVMVTSEGVHDARPARAEATPDCEGPVDLEFRQRPAADANVGIPAGAFESLAGAVTDRSRLVWAGSDHGVELVAWPTGSQQRSETQGSRLAALDEPVVSRFESNTFLDSSQVRDLATVGSGHETTLLIGTDYGLYYHSPALVEPMFALNTVTALSETRDELLTVDCTVDKCADVRWPQKTRTLLITLDVRSMGDPNRYQFVVEDGDQKPGLTERAFEVATGRGETKSLVITALDQHLNESQPQQVVLTVSQRTLGEWFTETNADWVAALIATALVAALSGFYVVRFLRRRGRHALVDVEVLIEPGADTDTALVTVAGSREMRIIDRARALGLWDGLRSSKNAEAISAMGDMLFDDLFSPSAVQELAAAGLGSRDVRLRLRGLNGDLDVLPWEALATGSGTVLARSRTSTVRDLRPVAAGSADDRLPAVDEVSFPVRVLVVVASPRDRADLDGADLEIEAIRSAAAAKFRGRSRGHVDVLEHASPEALGARLRLAPGYDFVHVIAHGERTGRGSRLWLEDVDQDAVRMETDELVDLLAGQERGVRRARLIVLNTCASAGDGAPGPGEAASSMATALVRRANVPAVVGMSMQIRTPAAVAFCGAFYKTLFRHGQVDHAMLVGRRAVAESDADWLAPRLYIGSSEPELFGGD